MVCLDSREGLNMGTDGWEKWSCVLYVSCNAEIQEHLISLLKTSRTELSVVWFVVKWWTGSIQ